jgi:hypothetical protein
LASLPGGNAPARGADGRPRTEVPCALVQTTGLPARTGRRTVPDMFTRHRTDPDRRQAEALAASFHDRLAGALLSSRTDPPRIDRRNLRHRLAASTGAGLRDRLDRGLSPT